MSVAYVRTQLRKLDPVCAEALSVPIYYINLDQSRDRRDYMESQLRLIDGVTRIEGIDGTVTHPAPRPELKQVGGPIVSDKHKPPPFKTQGVTFRSSYKLLAVKFGCTLSHLKALTRIEKDNCDWALVCEDDAVLTLSSKWPTHILENLCKEGDVVGAGIIQLYWGIRSDTPASKFNNHSVFTLVHIPLNPCWGTVAYLVSKRGVRDILDYTGRFPSNLNSVRPDIMRPITQHELSNSGLLYVDDPDKSPRHAAKYIHLPRKKLIGVADSFLYGLTPTYTCGKPLVLYDNCDMDAIVGNTNQTRSLAVQKKILRLYM
jgi:GR25 family glycosyltransferase involved in LPS biosynthesis